MDSDLDWANVCQLSHQSPRLSINIKHGTALLGHSISFTTNVVLSMLLATLIVIVTEKMMEWSSTSSNAGFGCSLVILTWIDGPILLAWLIYPFFFS
jgi:hypothetical protein